MAKFESDKSRELEKRTAEFGSNVILLCKKAEISIFNRTIIDQLIRSSTSIGANYMEANGASSRKDFANKIYLCRKEAQESKHWLKMLLTTNPEWKDQILNLADECRQLILIFQKINSTLKLSVK